MTRFLVILCTGVLLAIQGGCVCNKSRLHSKSSEKTISRVLEKEFALPMEREERLVTALGLVDSDQFALGVYEAQASADILLQLSRRGCQVFWPSFPDTNLLIQFSDEGNYNGYERWLLSDDPRSLNESERVVSSDGTEKRSLVHRGYISNYRGNRREYRRVVMRDVLEAKE